MHITVLVDNRVHRPDLHPQHGYSLWLDTEQGTVLLDTGQDELVVRHAAALEAPLASADWLVLTHGHYDHTGGVPAVLAAGARPRVAAHARIWEPRRSITADGAARDIGIPWSQRLLAETGLAVTNVTTATALLPGVWSTGVIPHYLGYHPVTRLHRATATGWAVDEFPDEQAVILTTRAGLVVCTGCCHAGLLNTLLAAQCVTGLSRIYAVIGGLHFHESSPDDVVAVADALRPWQIPHLWVSHCTGEDAYHLLRERLGPHVEWAAAGRRLELPPLLTERQCPPAEHRTSS